MFTDEDEVHDTDIEKYKRFLGVDAIATNKTTTAHDRINCLASDRHRLIFIDPDKGIKLDDRINSKQHIFGTEIVKLFEGNGERLLLIFDQSFARPKGKQSETIKKSIGEKLEYFRAKHIHAFAYLSHACFLVLSKDPKVCKTAYDHLIDTGLSKEKLYSEDF